MVLFLAYHRNITRQQELTPLTPLAPVWPTIGVSAERKSSHEEARFFWGVWPLRVNLRRFCWFCLEENDLFLGNPYQS